jgi:surface-anchored protein
MKITATLLMTAIFTLTHAEANDIRVLVSNAAGARVHDPAVGAGYVVLPAPHADLNVLWDATTQTFSGGFMTDSNANGGGAVVQFGPEDAIAYLPSTGQRQRTSTGTQYDFQGALGDTYWVFPSSSSSSNGAFSLYLGFSAYGVPNDGTFTGSGASTIGRIRWTVHSVENLSTPSATAFYGYSISAGNVNMQLTLDPAYPNREMVLLADGHSHLNLLFKAAGMYRITFRVRGTLVATGQEVSSLIPVYFGVERWEIPGAVQPPTGYDGWKLASFSPAQAADPAVSGLGADPDGDGADNLVEYAFNGNPLIPGVAGKPQMENLTDGGQEYLAIRYQRRKGDNTLSTTAESTADLSAVTWSGLGVQMGTGTAVGADYEEVVYRAPVSRADAPKQFMRVRVLRE